VPGAADVVAALEHHEVVDARFLQPDGHAEAGEAAADDDDVVLGAHEVLEEPGTVVTGVWVTCP